MPFAFSSHPLKQLLTPQQLLCWFYTAAEEAGFVVSENRRYLGGLFFAQMNILN
jgi:hypothetical protein